MQYVHRVNSYFAQNGVSAVALASVTSFSNSLFPLSGDAHVAYPEVKVTHADGSYTRHAFTSVDNSSLMDGRAAGSPLTKHTICSRDWIESTDGVSTHIASFLLPVSTDRKAMRGKPLSEETYDANGHMTHSVYYTYTAASATVPALCYNNTHCYNLTTYTAESPLLQVRTESSHGLVTESRYSYNTLGQKTVELVSSYPEPAGPDAYLAADTTRTTYTYLHESVDTTSLSAAIASATKVRIAGGVQTVVAAEDYAYGQWSAAGNPKPTLLRRLLPDGSVRSTSVSYDALFRPTALVRNPGGASISYIWNGNNLQSRTDNGAGNTTAFTWKDLVGPTLITAPSGQSTAYGYDTRNRLFLITDDAGSAVTKYSYKLINE